MEDSKINGYKLLWSNKEVYGFTRQIKNLEDDHVNFIFIDKDGFVRNEGSASKSSMELNGVEFKELSSIEANRILFIWGRYPRYQLENKKLKF